MLQIQSKTMEKSKLFSKTSAILFSATLSFCLTGCMGVYEGGFECPAGKGVGCKSISEVNTLVNQEELTLSEEKNQASSTEQLEESTECSCGKSPDFPTSESRIWYSPWVLEEI